MKKPKPIDYLCGACAAKLGWRSPPGHCCTMHMGKCDVCGEERALSCQDDWLKGNESKLQDWD